MTEARDAGERKSKWRPGMPEYDIETLEIELATLRAEHDRLRAERDEQAKQVQALRQALEKALTFHQVTHIHAVIQAALALHGEAAQETQK